MPAYYNEIDPFAAQWLRNLIAAGHIAAGDVDERSIADVKADDLKGYAQCHFFAGIGVWSHALRSAGWPDDRPVWTGSCPCQPFSAAGKGEGTSDARHLWPEWFRLIGEHRPVAVFGEQVSAAIRHDWLDLVSADLEGLDYAVGAAVLGAHSVGAPHIRQRLYFVADSQSQHNRRRESGSGRGSESSDRRPSGSEPARADGRDARAEGLQRGGEHGQQPQDGGAGGTVEQSCGQRRERRQATGRRNLDDRQTPERPEGQHGTGESSAYRGVALGDTERTGLEIERCHGGIPQDPVEPSAREGSERASASTFWSDCDWLPCIDGKARPVEPGTFPLAHGATARVGRLRAYGNAINAETARSFIEAYLAR